jgi:hypothetical protein
MEEDLRKRGRLQNRIIGLPLPPGSSLKFLALMAERSLSGEKDYIGGSPECLRK